MAVVLPDDVNNIGEFDRGGNVFTRIGATSVSTQCYACCVLNKVWTYLDLVPAEPLGILGSNELSPVWLVARYRPHAGSGVERIDPLRFLPGCHKRWPDQALSVLSLNLGSFWVFLVLLTRAIFVCSLSRLFLLGCQYQYKWSSPKWL